MLTFHQSIRNTTHNSNHVMLSISQGARGSYYQITDPDETMVLLDRLNNETVALMEWMEDHRLYRFTKYAEGENLVNLDFKLTVAQDIVLQENITGNAR